MKKTTKTEADSEVNAGALARKVETSVIEVDPYAFSTMSKWWKNAMNNFINGMAVLYCLKDVSFNIW